MVPSPITWNRRTAPRGSLMPIGRLLYPGGTMRLKGWRRMVASLEPAMNIAAMAVLLLCALLATYGMTVVEPGSLLATGLTVAFFIGAIAFVAWRRLLPSMRVRRIDCRPAHMFVALPSRMIWIDAVAGDRPDRADRREAVLWDATCSACGAKVNLVEIDDAGRKPPVGVCSAHPFDHVYTFHRGTLRGEWSGDGTVD